MKTKPFISLLLFGMFSLCVVALYNGYPLTEGDTGTYINNALFQSFCTDRPPFYGMFIRNTCLRTSLWYTIFVQGLITAFLLIRFMKLILGEFPSLRMGIVCMLVIASFTCVSWEVSELMPDAFTGILLLATILFILHDPSDKYFGYSYLLIIFLATIIHNSHFVIGLLFAVFVIVTGAIRKNRLLLKRGLAILIIPIIFWVTMCSMNSYQSNGFTFSKSGHVFLMARFAQMGILKDYLDENCPKKNLKICTYRDNLPPLTWNYMWDAQSPVQKMGGWDSCKKEDDFIIRDIITDPGFIIKLLQKSAISTAKQLTQVGIADKNYTPSVLSTRNYWHVATYISNEAGEYATAKQNVTGLSGTASNMIYLLFFAISTLWLLFFAQIINNNTRFVYLLIVAFLVINAWSTSTFSCVHFRFMSRVFWVLPATNAIIIIGYYWRKYNTIKQATTTQTK